MLPSIEQTIYVHINIYLISKMAGNKPGEENKVSAIISQPDYTEMMKIGTNVPIVNWMITEAPKINSIGTLARYIITLLVILGGKSFLEVSGFSSFKLSDMKMIKYYTQLLYLTTTTLDLSKSGDKWTYKNKSGDIINLSTSLLTTFFDKHLISITMSGSYYFTNKGYIIAVIVRDTIIKLTIPEIFMIPDAIEKLIVKECQEIIIGNNTIMVRIGNNNGMMSLVHQSPTYTFELKNYTRLKNMIRTHFSVVKHNKFQKIPLPIVFNGPPGVGKTTFGHFIAKHGDVDLVMIINMVQWTSTEFSEVINRLATKITELLKGKDKQEDTSVVLIFDELDKYFDTYLNQQVNKYIEDTRKTVVSSSSKPAGGAGGAEQSTPSTIVVDRLTPEEIEAKRKQIHNTFLDAFYNLCEGLSTLGNERNYALIFNCNEIERLFKNADSKHIALLERLQVFFFAKSDRKDIIRSIKDIDATISANVPSKHSPKIISGLTKEDFKLIPKDIKISFRDFMKKLTICGYNTKAFIKYLAENKDSEIIDADGKINVVDRFVHLNKLNIGDDDTIIEDPDTMDDEEESNNKNDEKLNVAKTNAATDVATNIITNIVTDNIINYDEKGNIVKTNAATNAAIDVATNIITNIVTDNIINYDEKGNIVKTNAATNAATNV